MYVFCLGYDEYQTEITEPGDADQSLKAQLAEIEKEATDILLAYSEPSNIENCVNLLNAPDKTSTHWSERISKRNDQWNDGARLRFHNARKECTSFKYCSSCFTGTPNVVIVCTTCMQELCPKCDIEKHHIAPFHKRELFVLSTFYSKKLLPTEFIESETGIIYNKGNFSCFKYLKNDTT